MPTTSRRLETTRSWPRSPRVRCSSGGSGAESASTSNPCPPGSLSLPNSGQTPPWTETIRTKVARGLLAALRDFGILSGAVRKEFAPPSLSIAGFGYVAFRLHEDGASSRALFASPVWRRWLLDPARVTELFHEAERQGLLRYSSAGSAVRVDWLQDTLSEVVCAVA